MNLDDLNENRVERALIQLSNTDTEHAEKSGEVKRLEELLKSVKAIEFLKATGTVAEREATALASEVYTDSVEAWAEAFKSFKTLDNIRNHEIRCVELWQTLSANRRKGNL